MCCRLAASRAAESCKPARHTCMNSVLPTV
jgi:hypothetical protein